MKPTNLKVGQRWIVTKASPFNSNRKYLDVYEQSGDTYWVRWDDGDSWGISPQFVWASEFMLEEAYKIQSVLNYYS